MTHKTSHVDQAHQIIGGYVCFFLFLKKNKANDCYYEGKTKEAGYPPSPLHCKNYYYYQLNTATRQHSCLLFLSSYEIIILFKQL